MTVASISEAPATASKHSESGRRRLRRGDGVLAIVFVLTSAFLWWTVATSGARADFRGDVSDYYGELTTGFLHGELSIPTPAPAGLVNLPDPYSPSLNNPWQGEFHDLALYHGHLYLDWGPTPVVTLYLPWRLIGLGNIPESWALWIYSALGIGFTLLLYRFLLSAYAPRARKTRIGFGAVALVLGGVVPFIDRTPDIYEVGVASAYCFLMLGLYLLASGGLAGRRVRWRLGVGSLALGLAAGGRWDLLLAVALVLPLGLWIIRRDQVTGWRPRTWLAALVVGPAAACVLLLLAYNYARFGNPLQVGTNYQMAGFDPTKTPYYLVGYLWPSLYYYLVAPVRWSLAFPYVALPPPPSYPFGVPATYAPEVIGGLFTISPILVLLFVTPFVMRGRVLREFRVATAALVVVALAIVALISLGVPGGSMRYEVDFATLLLVPAVIAFVSYEPSRRWGRRTFGVLGALLVVYGSVVSIAISIYGYHGQIMRTASGQVAAMEDVTRPVTYLVTSLLGHPVLTSGGCDAGFVSSGRYTTLGIGSVVYGVMAEGPCTLQVLGPHTGTWLLSMSETPIPIPKLTGARRTFIEVRDATGVHRYVYRWKAAGISLPVHLRGGSNTVSFWIAGRHLPHLPPSEGLVSFSQLTVAGPQQP